MRGTKLEPILNGLDLPRVSAVVVRRVLCAVDRTSPAGANEAGPGPGLLSRLISCSSGCDTGSRERLPQSTWELAGQSAVDGHWQSTGSSGRDARQKTSVFHQFLRRYSSSPAPSRLDPALYPPPRIRNFAIVAHVDHGKSTLADRLLEITGTVAPAQARAQYLDKLQVHGGRNWSPEEC